MKVGLPRPFEPPRPRRRAIVLLIYVAATLALDALAHGPFAPGPVLAMAATYCAGMPALPLAALLPVLEGVLWNGAPEPWHGLAFGLAGLLLRNIDFREAQDRLRDVVALTSLVAAAATVGTATQVIAAVSAGANPSLVLRGAAELFFSQSVAGLALLPALLMACRRGFRPWRVRPSWEAALQALFLLILCWEIFGRFANEEVRFFYLLFLPFAWIAARHGMAGTAAGLVMVYGALMLSHAVLVHRADAMLELEVRMLALTVISLLLAAIVTERRSAERLLLARQSELAHVLRLNIGWEMASGLAHELNQPLTAAMSYNEAGIRLLRGEPANLDKALSAFAKSLNQIERASDIIRRLREFMRKGEINVAPTPLADIVEDALQLGRTEPAADQIAFANHIPAGMPLVLADKVQIVQVLLNLVRNAVQAIAGGGEGAVVVAARLDGAMVEVTVSDTGPGIAPELAPRLFEPFVTTKASGMGLGLSLSKSILEAHGGRLWLEAGRPGQGAVFRFTLPAV